jgi:cytochrome c-type biogenesis protein CcmH
MTTFIVVCAAMVAAALLWLVWPLVRKKYAPAEISANRLSALAIAVAVPILAAVLYGNLSSWNFDEVAREAAKAEENNRLLDQLEAKLKENPQDLDGWLLLGRSNVATGRFAHALQAYQHAYDISKGGNVDAITGLAEAMVLVDSSTLTGRAAELFDAALAKAPNHPKALWYGSIAALQAGDLHKGRDRLQLLLAQNPPEQVRSVIERQVQDLNEQLGDDGAKTAGEGAVQQAGRSIRIAVSIAPAIQGQLTSGPLPMFVLARDPAGGPPLAVQRLSSASAPLTVELTERDAMMATRTIASAPRLELVARISKSGAPQERSGDFFGRVDFEFADREVGEARIVIDQVVP